MTVTLTGLALSKYWSVNRAEEEAAFGQKLEGALGDRSEELPAILFAL